MTKVQTAQEKVKQELVEYLANVQVCTSYMRGSPRRHEIAGFSVKLLQLVGGEDEGRDYFSVFSFEKDGVTLYVKFQGWYASHYGSEYEEYSFVKPVIETVTNYV